jgi:hypothetical protein
MKLATVLLLTALIAPSAFSQTSATLHPTDDTYVRSGTYAATNFNSDSILGLKLSSSPTDDFNRRILLKFDLTGQPVITSAKLRLYGSSAGATGVSSSVYSSSTHTWSETGATWNNQPAADATARATITLSTTAAWNEWNLTSFLQGEQAAGRTTVTLVVINLTSTSPTSSFTTDESASNRPELQLTLDSPPTVALTSVVNGSLAQGTVPLFATAADNIGVASVQYFLDGIALGAPVTTAPYALLWDTTAATAGGHTLSAVAKDTANQTATHAITVVARGAGSAFTTYEAEDGSVSSPTLVTRLTAVPTNENSTPEMESSGRAYVGLSATGQYVEWTNVRAADAIVVRYSIPEAATVTLSLYVNGVHRQDLTLAPDQIVDPAVAPATGSYHFFNEVRAAISGTPLAAGSTVRLQKDSTDTAAYYWIDLIELTTRPAPLTMPPGALDATASPYNAIPNDGLDDTDAIQACINAAKLTTAKTVWLPAGDYTRVVNTTGSNLGATLTLDGVKLQGAGWWHTKLVTQIPLGTPTGAGTAYRHQIAISGDGPAVRDMYIYSNQNAENANGGHEYCIVGSPTNWTVENVWIRNTGSGVWCAGSGGTVRGNRVIATYADGIHLASGASTILVEHNTVRGTGDDGIALIDETASGTPAINTITVRRNTSTANYWGAPFDLAGGYGHLIEHNIFADSAKAGALAINHTGNYPPHPLTSATIQSNSILRGGGYRAGGRGAFWILGTASSISGVTFNNNEILGSIFKAVHVQGASATTTITLSLANNEFDQAGTTGGTYGIHIESSARGSATFTNNVLLNQSPSYSPALLNQAGANFPVTLSGNSGF